MLYLSEGSGSWIIEHRYSYSKTVDLPKSADNGSVTIEPKVDYATCRAVSGRRIDVRGAVSFKIKVSAVTPFEIITDIDGCNIQTKKNRVPVLQESSRQESSLLFVRTSESPA